MREAVVEKAQIVWKKLIFEQVPPLAEAKEHKSFQMRNFEGGE